MEACLTEVVTGWAKACLHVLIIASQQFTSNCFGLLVETVKKLLGLMLLNEKDAFPQPEGGQENILGKQGS